MEPIYDGFTPTEHVQPATKAQLIALRDLLLSHNDKNAAAAADNLIDILSRVVAELPFAEPDPRTAQQIEDEENRADFLSLISEMRGGG